MRSAYVVLDLGYGDQGKGTITDFLVRDRQAHTVVRFNGGAQAGHNVVLPDGRHHTFAQFGAGSFVPAVETVLTSDVLIQPWAMLVEAEHLARVGVHDAFERTLIAGGAPVLTPFHRAVNRLREHARGPRAHGSCGMGVGETVADARSLAAEDVVVAGDLLDATRVRDKLLRVQERKRAECLELLREVRGDPATDDERRALEEASLVEGYLEPLERFRRRARIVGDAEVRAVLRRDGVVVLEGAQGVLLDERVGFHPHTTWSRCTDENAAALLRAHDHDGRVLRIGVVRAYATRHGAGPLVTEDPDLAARLPEAHNDSQGFQGRFRVGHFDAVATRYAMRACERIDALAVTCLDRLHEVGVLRIATRYRWSDGRERRELEPCAAEALLHARPVYEVSSTVEAHLVGIGRETMPPALVSVGPTAADKRWIVPPSA